MKKNLPILSAITLLGLVLSGCSSSDKSSESSGVVKVVAAMYPLEFVAKAIGGDLISVENFTPPGVEPHDLELTPSQVVTLDDASLLLYISGFQPAVEEAAQLSAPANSLDLLSVDGLDLLTATEDGHNDGAEPETGDDVHSDEEMVNDPHVWLDPKRLVVIAKAVASKLSEIDPDNSASYETNLAVFVEELETLDQKFVAGLASCQRDLIVTSHAAFGYLADAYGLSQEALAGLSPESEPTPKRLNEIGKEAKADGTTTIFFETLASPKVAQTLANDLNIEAAVLDPIEGISEGQTYFSVMESNLEALRKALNCK
ncbi:MAG: zinc ABC transporter substrate-binding protein [Candidatus Nanopelagicaceae bacterium]|nr:zinc ABC transporter substrate-binding protein [Candidatus Nanopelagicaceae bacterium]